MAIQQKSKRESLFEKRSSDTNHRKKTSKTKVRDVNGFVMTVVYYAVRIYFFLCGVRLKTVNKVGHPEKPSIILCNHGSFIDFIYAAALLRKYKPNFIVARLYFYHDLLGWLLRTVGAFPKSMFAVDLENAKNYLTVLKEKNHLAMMPEARLSAGVLWWRRSWIFCTPRKQVKNLSLEQLKQGVEQRLGYDEFQWLQQRPDIHYRSRHMAQGLENILTTCPVCGRKYTITTEKDKISCEYCGYLTSLDDRYGFTGNFRFGNLAEWYDWQKALLEKQIGEKEDCVLSSKVELRLPGRGKKLTRHDGDGVCTLSRDGLTYSGTRDGETVEIHFFYSTDLSAALWCG